VGKQYETLTPELVEFIESQKMFFVATAPLEAGGHVNVSPKGMDSFRVLDERTVAYLDVTGSGVETISHVRENGRIVIMFCAFEGKPLIVRLHGRGEVLEAHQSEFGALKSRFPDLPGMRAIIRITTTRIADSCGWTVPLYEFEGTRDYYDNYAQKKGPAGIREGQLAANMKSIDGLPGLSRPSM
jgi:hypothetical protein